eukprot:6307089-Alexandrium_andersonii.AAC.1
MFCVGCRGRFPSGMHFAGCASGGWLRECVYDVRRAAHHASGCAHVARCVLVTWLHGCARARLNAPALAPQSRATARVRACVHACVRARVCVRACVRAC